MSSQEDPATDLATRYATPAPWRRGLVAAVAGALVLAFAGWLTWATLYHAEPEAQSQLVSFEVVDAETVAARLDVELAEGVTALCRLRAYAEDHAVVGELAFEPDPAAGPRYDVEIRTERLATTVDPLGCTTADQPRPR